MIEILQAIFLGVVEGFTEFLPISSTGHLIVSERVIGYKDTAEIFTIVIQMGAIGAVIWFYRSDLIKKIVGLVKRDKKTLKFWANWIIATIPAGLAGFFLKDQLSKYAVVWVIAVALIVGGILIWLIENYHKAPKNDKTLPKFDELTPARAVRVGLYQILALVPGVSRSGATIMGGLLSGLDRVTATTFSFYLSIPIIVLAGSYQLFKGRHELATVSGGALALVVGTVVSFVTALIAIKWLLRYVSTNNFKFFAYYRIIIGCLLLVAFYL